METSFRLFEVVEDGHTFSPLSRTHPQTCDCGGYGYLLIEELDTMMDGIFETERKWNNFADSVDKDGGEKILDFLIDKKMKGDNGYCLIERESKFGSDCTLTFKEPIPMVVGGYRSAKGEWVNVVEEISYLKGEITWEWIWYRGKTKAQGIEIYLHITDYGQNTGKVVA